MDKFKYNRNVSDLLYCEKKTADGYCGLDTNSLISTSNIPNLSESQINNLNNDLNNITNLVSGYLKNSEIPLSVP